LREGTGEEGLITSLFHGGREEKGEREKVEAGSPEEKKR